LNEQDGGFFVVVSTDQGPCAWLVDQVAGIEDCGELEACPPILAAQVHQAVAGVFRQGDRLVTVLDPDRCGAQFSAAEPELLAA
jgi:chemotaxis signal transduction protein